jgi:hypothetical protein
MQNSLLPEVAFSLLDFWNSRQTTYKTPFGFIEFLRNQILKINRPLNRAVYFSGFKKLENQFLKNSLVWYTLAKINFFANYLLSFINYVLFIAHVTSSFKHPQLIFLETSFRIYW